MPTYVYACKHCGHRFEQYQSFSEDALRTCPSCGEPTLRKVFDTVGVVFKGSGFYSTDAKSSSTSTHGAEAGSGSTATGGGSTTGPSTTSSAPTSTGASEAAAASS